MENTVLHRLKESLLERRDALAEWIQQAAEGEIQTKTGLSGKDVVERQIGQLDNAVQKADNGLLGLCDVCHDYVDTSRLEMDYLASVCIDHLSGEERTRLETELELSQKVQKALLPNVIPSIHGLDISVFSQPAHIVGGDYFDFFKYRDGSHGFVIADVMGKGMPASMLMASFQASLRIIGPESNDPAEVMTRLNQIFCRNIRLTKFVTVFLARYDENSRVLTYCNAGHNPPLIHRNNGAIESLLPTGAAIGLVDQATFENATTILRPNDKVLLYTDGVVESRNPSGDLFGEERLRGFLMETVFASSRQLIGSLRDRLQQFSGVSIPTDDTTIIAIKG
jgi:sigma-B regulation protein RsbU (phosphoserine phosphatase)